MTSVRVHAYNISIFTRKWTKIGKYLFYFCLYDTITLYFIHFNTKAQQNSNIVGYLTTRLYQTLFSDTLECRVRMVECRVRKVECRVRMVECRVRMVECRVRMVKCRVRKFECRVRMVECRVRNVECRVRMVECRVRIIIIMIIIIIIISLFV